MREFKLTDSYNNELHTYVFDEVIDVKGIFQLLHGINENGLRYTEFAMYLNKQGYIVYVHDHVSQGMSRTEKDKDIVYFGKNGGTVLVDGMTIVRKQIEIDYPDQDVYVFGHSLGSMIIRKFLIEHKNNYKRIIINGGGFSSTKGLNIALMIGGLFKLFGKKRPSNFFDNVFRETQLKLSEKVEMNHFIEWLTRDELKTQVNKLDALLYIRLSISVFVDMLKVMKEINNESNIKKMNIDVPILLMSGTHDPATDFGAGTSILHALLIDAGFDSTVKLYEEGRHDTLQEINRDEVFEDIINWIGAK